MIREVEIEDSFEHIPTKQEVLDIVEQYDKEYEIVSELSDEQGLYFLQVRVKGKKGEKIWYDYQRMGKFPAHEFFGTSIYKTHYNKERKIIGSPELIAEYDYEKGEWKKL